MTTRGKTRRSLSRTGALLLGAALPLAACQSAATEDEPAWPDVGLVVFEREQIDADVPPDGLLDSPKLDGIDPSSTRLVASHGHARFFVGFGNDVAATADSTLELCFFVDTADYNAGPIICGPLENYGSLDGVETWYGKGDRALLVPGIHNEPGMGWVRVEPNLYVKEATASTDPSNT
jgi:hypothetical protein